MKSSTEEFTKVAFSCLQLFSLTTNNKAILKQKKTKLNLFGKGITHIKTLIRQEIQSLQQIKQIDLSHNALTSIQNLKQLPLSQVNFSHNKISEQDIFVLLFLKDKNCELTKNLKKISLKGNPFLKKPLSPEIRRWLLSIQNDLQLFTKEEYEYLDLLVQRFVEKVMLQNLLNKLLLNLNFLQEYRPRIEQDFEKLLLTRPQDYFKTIKRQMEWKIQTEPLTSVRKQVIMSLPFELFGSGRQRMQVKQYASQLILELRKRNENLIKHNKEIVQKIQQAIFNYLTQRKMLVENQQKSGSQTHSIKTPYKNLFAQKRSFQAQSSKRCQQQVYPQIHTPIYTKRYSTSKPKMVNIIESEYQTQQQLTNRLKFVETKEERNPFDEIARQMEQSGRKEDKVMRKISKNKENIIFSPSKHQDKPKKIEIKNSSKTLFELSQSLLQRPVITSDQSLHFQIEDGVTQSQIEKMFFQILTKLNPIYHLLYSPIESLKSTEKNSLISNLLQLLKEKLKYIEKLQKFKLLYETQKLKHQELLALYKKEKQNLEAIWSRKQDLTLELKQAQNQVNFLSDQVQLKTQQNYLLIEQNDSLKDQLRHYHDSKLQRDQEQRIEDLIRSKRQTIIKNHYFTLLTIKAEKIHAFKHNMEDLSLKENRNILYSYFIQMSKEAEASKKFKNLSQKVIRQNLTIFKSTIQTSIQLRNQIGKKQSFFRRSIMISHTRQLIEKLNQIKSSNQKHAIAQKNYDRKLKRKFLRYFQKNVEFQKGIQYERMVIDFRKESKQRLKKWVFDEWLIWQKGLLHKQVQVRVNHEGIVACNVIERLCDLTSRQRSHHAKSVALQHYLRDMRTFNSFHKLYYYMCTETQKWKIKLFKINMFTKRIFYDDFLSGVRFKKNKRKIKQKDQEIVCRKLQFNQLSQFKLKKKILQHKIKNKIRHCYFMKLMDLMMITRKQIEVEKLLQTNKIGFLFEQLKSAYKQKSWFKTKKRQVELLARAYYASQANNYSVQDVFSYFRRRLVFKRSLVKFFINKNKRLLEKTFYQFRINCLEEKALFFQEKLRELGPDIELIEQRQIQTNIEKLSLCRQLELKNQQMQEYEKQVQELKLLLQAKEIKYEKLKEIYAQTIQINAKEREYYETQSRNIYQSLPYGQKYNTSSKNSQNSQNLSQQKSVKFESKPEANRIRLQTISGYSPQRDTMMSKQKRKVNDLINEAKNFPSLNFDHIEKGIQRGQKSNKKQKLSQIYPSFRRF